MKIVVLIVSLLLVSTPAQAARKKKLASQSTDLKLSVPERLSRLEARVRKLERRVQKLEPSSTSFTTTTPRNTEEIEEINRQKTSTTKNLTPEEEQARMRVHKSALGTPALGRRPDPL